MVDLLINHQRDSNLIEQSLITKDGILAFNFKVVMAFMKEMDFTFVDSTLIILASNFIHFIVFFLFLLLNSIILIIPIVFITIISYLIIA